MNSLAFRVIAHIVAALMLIFSMYLLFRGHNEPGGGFIGALIASIGFTLLMMAESVNYVRWLLKFEPAKISVFGILITIISGLVGIFSGLPFLSGVWSQNTINIGTPLIFDLGVFLGVFGSVAHIVFRINEEIS